ncbi:MAG: RNA polymerase sigma factor [Vicinamibacterales bacterium]
MDPRALTSIRSDGEAVRQADASVAVKREGDEAARNELSARYLPRLRRWAHGRLPGWARDHLDTEHLVQETLLQSVSHLDTITLQNERAFCTHVCEALRSRMREALRRVAGRSVSESQRPDAPAADPSPIEQAIGGQILRGYEGALQRLREADRELVIERVELNLDYREIADLHGTTIAGARVAVGRALLRLSAEMDHERQP